MTNHCTLPCIHCGLPTDCSPDDRAADIFCCSGCQGAYQLIHGWGLGDFYALREQMPHTGSAQAADSGTRYELFDSAEYLGPSAPKQSLDGLCSTKLAVHGLHCGACAWLIENAASREPGLEAARVNMSDHSVQLVFDPKAIQLSQIARLFDRLGYSVAPLDETRDNHVQMESRRLLVQIAIAGFFAVNAMWIAIALYAGEYSGVAPQHRYFLGLIGTGLGLMAVVGPGRSFFVGALASVKTRTPHMDLPIALGLLAGTLVGTVSAITGRGHMYFDSMAVLVFLLLIGRWIQFRQQQRAARAVDLMLRITPRHAEMLDETDATKCVLVDRLVAGDLIRVGPGQSIPADGQVVSGCSTIDRSLLTGESQPVPVETGSQVSAGTVNLVSAIDVRVAAVGHESRIGQVMQSVELAATEKTPIVQLADRIGGLFVVTVTVLASITFVWWSPTGIGTATSHATSLLIVACPCALALATPLAIAVGLGRAAKRGVLIRDGRTFQLLTKPGVLWLDKTGTLTEGRQRVTSIIGSEEGLRLAAAVERLSVHPVAGAIVRAAEKQQCTPPEQAELSAVVAGGVAGTANEKQVLVGNWELMERNECSSTGGMQEQAKDLAACGQSPIFIAIDGRVRTLLGISDPLRPSALETVKNLKKLGWSVGILSGDHPEIAYQVATTLGIASSRCFGGLSPEEKLTAIRDARCDGRTVVMVGDGANDAAALAAADVGIAVRGGAEISLQAAPVFIASGRLNSLVDLIRGSKRTTTLIYLSFVVSLSYNIVAVGLAMSGKISPLVAAVLMPISSISVLALTLTYRSFPDEPAAEKYS